MKTFTLPVTVEVEQTQKEKGRIVSDFADFPVYMHWPFIIISNWESHLQFESLLLLLY